MNQKASMVRAMLTHRTRIHPVYRCTPRLCPTVHGWWRRAIPALYIVAAVFLLPCSSGIVLASDGEEQWAAPPIEKISAALKQHTSLRGVQFRQAENGSIAQAFGMKSIAQGVYEYVVLVDLKLICEGNGPTPAFRRLLRTDRTEPMHVVTCREDGRGRVICSYLFPPGPTGMELYEDSIGGGVGGIPDNVKFLEYSPEAFKKMADESMKSGDRDRAVEIYRFLTKWYPLAPQARLAAEKINAAETQETSRTIDNLLSQAKGYWQNKDFDAAVAAYDKLIKEFPGYAKRDEIIQNIGAIKAEKAQRSADAKKAAFDNLVRDGDLMMEQGLWEAAIKGYAEALKIASDKGVEQKLETARASYKDEQARVAKAESEKRTREAAARQAEITTKLDKAKAQIDNGDLDQAKTLLAEVAEKAAG